MLGITLRDPVGLVSSWPALDILPSATLREASDRLAENLVGILVVSDPRGLLGVVSERDVVRAISDGADPDVERVVDVMTDDVAVLDDDASIREAADAMSASEVRHLLVRIKGGYVGVVSMRDVVAVVLSELDSRNGDHLLAR